jgi:hypothetical protein
MRTQHYIYAWRDKTDSPLEIILPEESMWYKFYLCNSYINEDAKLAKEFNNYFRLPYTQFLELVDNICLNEMFDQWCGYKSNNEKVSPVELLCLGWLCYLGRRWTFDNCEQSTAIDADDHHMCVRVFLEFGSTVLYKNGC